MSSHGPVRTRVYGTLTIYFHFLTACFLVSGVAIYAHLFLTGGIVTDRLTALPCGLFVPEALFPTLAAGVFVGLIPVFCVLLHSPRTRSRDITVGTDQGVPALLFRQSRLIYTLSVAVAIPAFTAAIVLALKYHDDPEFDPTPDEHRIKTWILLLVVTCGYQAGIAVLIALGRVRPGYIAIRHDGVRLRGYANDAWIPWDSISCTTIPHHQYLVFRLTLEHDAIISSRVPRLWTHIDKREIGYAHPSRPRESVHTVAIDRRHFRIAPEIIDGAVDHFIENPAARAELRDPAAIAHMVGTLRAHATTAWWRSQTRPVPVPGLAPDDRSQAEPPRPQ